MQLSAARFLLELFLNDTNERRLRHSKTRVGLFTDACYIESMSGSFRALPAVVSTSPSCVRWTHTCTVVCGSSEQSSVECEQVSLARSPFLQLSCCWSQCLLSEWDVEDSDARRENMCHVRFLWDERWIDHTLCHEQTCRAHKRITGGEICSVLSVPVERYSGRASSLLQRRGAGRCLSVGKRSAMGRNG